MAQEKTTYGDLHGLITMVESFYGSPEAPMRTLAQAAIIAKTLGREVPEVSMIYGSGYPHYLSGTDITFPDEFKRYFSWIKEEKLPEEIHDQHWSCLDCLHRNAANIVGIKEFCRTCREHIPFQPIDVLRLLPDVDLELVVPEITPEVVKKITCALEKNGWNSPEQNLLRTINETRDFIQGNAENPSQGNLHPDVYIISEKNINRALHQIKQGRLEQAYVYMLGYHGKWHPVKALFSTDLWSAAYHPLMIRDIGLAERIKRTCITHANMHPDIERVVVNFMSLLANHDGKNFRIQSQPEFTERMEHLIGQNHRVVQPTTYTIYESAQSDHHREHPCIGS